MVVARKQPRAERADHLPKMGAPQLCARRGAECRVQLGVLLRHGRCDLSGARRDRTQPRRVIVDRRVAVLDFFDGGGGREGLGDYPLESIQRHQPPFPRLVARERSICLKRATILRPPGSNGGLPVSVRVARGARCHTR